jgi:hypothetical protein
MNIVASLVFFLCNLCNGVTSVKLIRYSNDDARSNYRINDITAGETLGQSDRMLILRFILNLSRFMQTQETAQN